MYGIIYKAIESYIIQKFGHEKWLAIKVKSGITADFSRIEQPYNDDITYRLAETASLETGVPVNDLLADFGEWVIKTVDESYSDVVGSRGNSLRDYLLNLPNYHNRMMLIYPEMTPPEFRVSNVEGKSLNFHYISKRNGISDFIKGYLNGLVKFFNETVTIENIQTGNGGSPEEVFKISW